MIKFIITEYTHGFKVKVAFSNLRYVAINFARIFTSYELVFDRKARRKVMRPTTVFATANPTMDEFGFLLRDLPEFLAILERMGITDSEITRRIVKPKKGVAISFKMPGIEARPHQIPALKFLAELKPTRVLPLPTGTGKTLTTLMSLMAKGERAMLVMQAGHIKTWLATINEMTDVSKKDIMVVQGSNSMEVFVQLADMNAISEKLILVSSTTFDKYLETYIKGEAVTGRSYPVRPEDLMAKAGIGVCVVDECHELLKQVVRRTIMLNVPQWIFLSATLRSNQDTINRIYESIYPISDQFTDFVNNSHATVHPTYYRLLQPNTVKCSGPQGYNHNIYETFILSRPKLREGYFDMIYSLFTRDYIKNRKPKTRALVFFSSIACAEAFGSYLKDKLPSDMSFGVYHSQVPPKAKATILENSELLISTPKSLGTGIDIPNITFAVMTQALASTQLAQQVLGRPRIVKEYKDESPRFYYLSCLSIDKHLQYDRNHLIDFSDKSKIMIPIHTGIAI